MIARLSNFWYILDKYLIKFCYFGYNLGIFDKILLFCGKNVYFWQDLCLSAASIGIFLLELGSFSQELGIFGKNFVDFGNKWVFLLWIV